MNTDANNQHVFLLGMSGIGMQALAIIAQQSGYRVSGFDDSLPIETLQKQGIEYLPQIPDDAKLIVFSSAIKETHPLMIAARMRNIPCVNRTDFLIEYIKFNENIILIAGAHGKTTTTSMTSYVLGMKSFAIGGIVNGYKFAGQNEKDKYTVIETDESDGSFIKWHGTHKILLNYDFEHMDFFQTEERVFEYYRKFVLDDLDSTKLVIEAQAKHELEIADHPNIITYGPADCVHACNFRYGNIVAKEDGLSFDITHNEGTYNVFVPLFGVHNASNFTAVYAMCHTLGLSHEEITQRIAKFPGAKKRMQQIKEENGFVLYSDYGHHPKEVGAVLKAVWEHKKIRVNVVLEPHRYTRMQYTWNQWPDALKEHKVFVYPLHTAAEAPIDGISSQCFVEYLKQHGIDAVLLNDIHEYQINNHTICFSAGKLCAQLEKIS